MCFGSFLSYAVYKRWHGQCTDSLVSRGAIPEVVCDLGDHFPANFVTTNKDKTWYVLPCD